MELSPSRAGARLALGTVQFGASYGINNQRGRVPETETSEILALAEAHGIDTLDTAPVYGDSEPVLGRLSVASGRFRLVSKLPACSAGEAEGRLRESCRSLRTPALYGYLLHHFDSYRKDPKVFGMLGEFKRQGLVQKIGFSLYRPEELQLVLERGQVFDLVQIPGNVLDRRFLPHLEKLKSLGVEVHVRSAFLQGLLLSDPAKLSGRLRKVRPALEELRGIAARNSLSVASLCLNFVLAQGHVDKVVVGVDGLAHLRENLEYTVQLPRVRNLLPELAALEQDDEEILIPSNWG